MLCTLQQHNLSNFIWCDFRRAHREFRFMQDKEVKENPKNPRGSKHKADKTGRHLSPEEEKDLLRLYAIEENLPGYFICKSRLKVRICHL